MQGMSLGIGMSGFLVAIISFVTIWWVPPADRSGSHVKTPAEAAPEAFLYFVLSSITIAAAIVTYFIFFRMRYVRAHRQPQGECFLAGPPHTLFILVLASACACLACTL